MNSAFTSISGFTSLEAIGKSTFDVLNSNSEQFQKRLENWKKVNDLGAWQGEIEVLSKSGEELSLLVRIKVVKKKTKEIQYYIISYIDISKRKALEKELRYLSEKDSLSDCWNRRKFEFELEKQTLLTNRYYPAHQCCLAILDIDWFKRINDTQGHEVGDKVIKLVADVLKQSSRETDFVARIGGEEFAIIMPHTELKSAEMVVNRLRVAISQLDDYQVTISGGLTDIGISHRNAYKCADIALYESKANGRNTISICTSLDDLA
ncbi:sensor domain-containing diguanylate cyclase [Aliivibrio sifiae]